jgi:hypothetical protein
MMIRLPILVSLKAVKAESPNPETKLGVRDATESKSVSVVESRSVV